MTKSTWTSRHAPGHEKQITVTIRIKYRTERQNRARTVCSTSSSFVLLVSVQIRTEQMCDPCETSVKLKGIAVGVASRLGQVKKHGLDFIRTGTRRVSAFCSWIKQIKHVGLSDYDELTFDRWNFIEGEDGFREGLSIYR